MNEFRISITTTATILQSYPIFLKEEKSNRLVATAKDLNLVPTTVSLPYHYVFDLKITNKQLFILLLRSKS